MKRRYRGIQRLDVACPECENTFTIKWRKGVKRPKARKHICPSCGFVGYRGQFDDPIKYWESPDKTET